MSTLENTISMLEVLPETDLLEIQQLTKKLFQRHKTETPDEAVGRFLKPMSQEDFYRDAEIAEQQIIRGEYQEMGEAIDEISRKLKI